MEKETLNAIEQAEEHIKHKFSIVPKKSTILTYNQEYWNEFQRVHQTPIAQGAYTAKNHTAHISLNNPNKLHTIFHEYFGHGMDIEYTRIGQLFHKLTNTHQKPEVIATLINSMREKSEGFANWMEWYLTNKITPENSFHPDELEGIPPKAKKTLEQYINYSQEYGEHALLFSHGIEKHYTPKILEEILVKIFPGKKIDLALLYGSQKPYSDIDIFLVSDEIPNSDFGWLDIYSVRREQFYDLAGKLDLSLTNALFAGDYVCGDKRLLEGTQQNVLQQDITREAIDHHTQLISYFKQKEKEKYATSYELNAQELSKGRKALTLNSLKQRYPERFR